MHSAIMSMLVRQICFIISLVVLVRSVVPFETEVTWYAPFLSGGGYCSEATSFMFALDAVNYTDFAISHHGDSFRSVYWNGLTEIEKSKIQYYDIDLGRERRTQKAKRKVLSIDVCHSEPGAWDAPHPRYHTTSCPSKRRRFNREGHQVAEYNIGRTMFETDRLPDGWVHRLNFMDEVWVPTEYAREIFLKAGVSADKLVVLGEAVDTDFYKPVNVAALTESKRILLGLPDSTTLSSNPTVFLFVGKFETRKGLRTLLRAYYTSFSAEDNVLLIILTSAYHASEDFEAEINALLAKEKLPMDTLINPPRYTILSDVPQEGMPYLYSLADALVIPSHGEGWGRPHMEAMACGTPVIATNWSGPVAFLDSSVGYPISILPDLVPAEGWSGHFWAQPNVTHLSQILQSVHRNPAEAAVVGERARERIKDQFSLPAMGARLVEEFSRIEQKMRAFEEKAVNDNLKYEL